MGSSGALLLLVTLVINTLHIIGKKATLHHLKFIMANNGKAFSSQINKMSKQPLKYNPEEVMMIKVDMDQDMFNFAMDTARDALGKFNKEDEPGMSKYAVNQFNEEFGEHWMSIVGDNFGVAVGYKGNFAQNHFGIQRFCNLQSCLDTKAKQGCNNLNLFNLEVCPSRRLRLSQDNPRVVRTYHQCRSSESER